MKKLAILLFGISIVVAIVLSCNKINSRSRKLARGERWDFAELVIDGVSSKVGETYIIEDDFKKKVPLFRWINNEDTCEVEWQFQEKGKVFVFNYVFGCVQCQQNDFDTLDYLADALNGRYTVSSATRKKMVFESSETKGFPNKSVKLVWNISPFH